MADPGSNNVVPQGADYVFAFHDVLVDLTGLYDYPVTITMPDGTTQTIPPPDIVFAPRGFIYAYDVHGRRLDPRRFAGEGGTPLGGGPQVTPYAGTQHNAPPTQQPPPPLPDWSAIPGLPIEIPPPRSEPIPLPPSPELEVQTKE